RCSQPCSRATSAWASNELRTSTRRRSRPFPPAAKAMAPPLRTTFAVTLQLARCFPALIALVLAGYADDPLGAHRAARQIADGIPRGARDRSRQSFPRTLHDQHDELIRFPRPRRRARHAVRLSAKAAKGADVAA